MMIIAMILSVLLVMLQALDGWTTYQTIKRGAGREVNPVMIWLIELLGLYPALVAAKTWVVAIVAWGWAEGAWHGDIGVGLLFGLTLVYVWVVLGNHRVLYGRP